MYMNNIGDIDVVFTCTLIKIALHNTYELELSSSDALKRNRLTGYNSNRKTMNDIT